MASLLMTTPGVGYYSALLIVSEIGDISRLPDSHHLCSYAGLIPSTHSSGNTPANGFDSGILAPGKTFTHTFGTPGTIQYYCTVHPTMLGEVMVK